MLFLRRKPVDIQKVTVMTIIVNGFQIVAAALVLLIAVFRVSLLNDTMVQIALSALTLVVIWGATIDIREAFFARRLSDQAGMLEDSLSNLETLNVEMRKQRHDFMNHLQVVYSLVELGEADSACEYIERVVGDLRRVGQSLKTNLPAVNALIAAKQNDAESRNVIMDVMVRSAWDELPIPAWEMCRVIGNLVDNSFDALTETVGAHIGVTIGEDDYAYLLSIENNGPEIPTGIRERIFEERFSTKGHDRGMGLAIVREIAEGAGGSAKVESDPLRTRFNIVIPKKPDKKQAAIDKVSETDSTL